MILVFITAILAIAASLAVLVMIIAVLIGANVDAGELLAGIVVCAFLWWVTVSLNQYRNEQRVLLPRSGTIHSTSLPRS